MDAFEAVDNMLSEYQQNGTTSAQALAVAQTSENVYAYVTAEIAYNGKTGNEIADQTAEIVDGYVGDLDAETRDRLKATDIETAVNYLLTRMP